LAKPKHDDPTTGRYIQADPLGLVDGASTRNLDDTASPNQKIVRSGNCIFATCGPVRRLYTIM